MTIRTLFSTRRPIDRPIEKVIDYYAADDARLQSEIEEYEVTDNVDKCFTRFLDVYDAGVRTGQVTEIGVWVAGFYGAGKSSFTEYLGFALDSDRKIAGRPFLDFLCERITSVPLQGLLRTTAKNHGTAVVLLDLGSEQLADNTLASVSTVLYWKVLQYAGYSKDKKLAELELKLQNQGLYDKFRQAYREKFGDDWETIHNDSLSGVGRAAQLVPTLLPKDYPTDTSFLQMRSERAEDLRDRAGRIIELVRRKSGKQNILFLIDEAGQYVAPRGELILNLDGLARNFKELGQGRVWIVATGQQTLAEIVEKAAYNSPELNKLRDRFPIGINLEPSDIREITYRRLLSKSNDGLALLKEDFSRQGQALLNFTRLSGTSLFKGDPDADTFAKLYPFLPQHFDLLLELIRALATSRGGLGLRSAIRVIQDLLVDASKVLPAGTTKLADRPIRYLACADDFYDTLRADIAKVLPHVVRGVDRVAKAFSDEPQALRVAKAIGALQPLESFPRTAENIAALLYPALGTPSLADSVREALRKLVANRECGVIEDPQTGGYLFLSEGVKPLRDKRNAHVPTALEINQTRVDLLQEIFETAPSVKIENSKEVKAGVRLGKNSVVGEDNDIQFRIEAVDASSFDQRRTALLSDTNTNTELKNSIVWLVRSSEEAEDLIAESCRSDWILKTPEREADKDVAQFLRAERRARQRNREDAGKLLSASLDAGTLIFRGQPKPVSEAGATLDAAARNVLETAAQAIFPNLRLVPIRPSTDLAGKFLAVERLDRMPRELDPLGLVVTRGGRPRIDVNNQALAETLRAFGEELNKSGGRLQGNFIQDFFYAPPYGWSKDATRYLFAALLLAGEIELFTAGGKVTTSGPLAVESFKSTVAFNRVGVARRDTKIPLETLERASNRLQEIFGVDVLPIEDNISRTAREQVPGLVEKIGSLPDRLRLLGLPGRQRAADLIATCGDLTKQDAGSAASILGAPASTIVADARWARDVTSALDNGAERELSEARKLESDLKDLGSLFPRAGSGIATAQDSTIIREALSSEEFHTRLPALRTAVRNIIEGVRARYAQQHTAFLANVKDVRDSLEAMREWLLISPEDRAEIVSQIDGSSVPAKTELGQELSQLRVLLTRDVSLGSLSTQLKAEVRRRVPAPEPEPPVLPPTEPKPLTPEEPPAEQEVNPADLPVPDVIATRADLDAWLASLGEQLAEILRQKKVIRFRKPEPQTAKGEQ